MITMCFMAVVDNGARAAYASMVADPDRQSTARITRAIALVDIDFVYLSSTFIGDLPEDSYSLIQKMSQPCYGATWKLPFTTIQPQHLGFAEPAFACPSSTNRVILYVPVGALPLRFKLYR